MLERLVGGRDGGIVAAAGEFRRGDGGQLRGGGVDVFRRQVVGDRGAQNAHRIAVPPLERRKVPKPGCGERLAAAAETGQRVVGRLRLRPLPLPELRERECEHGVRVGLADLRRLLLRLLEVAGVVQIEREVVAKERLARKDPDDFLHHLDRALHLPQQAQTQGELVAPGNVGAIFRHRVTVFLDALLVVVGRQAVGTARVIALAVGHAVQVLHCLLEILPLVGRAAEIARLVRRDQVAKAEVLVDLDRLLRVLQRLLELVRRGGGHRRGIGRQHVERGRRQRGHGKLLRRFRQFVTEGVAHPGHEPGGGRQHGVAARGALLLAEEFLAGDRALPLHGHPIATPLLGDRARQHHAQALFERDLLRRRLRERRGRRDAEAAHAAALVCGDERRVVERELHHRLERVIEGLVASLVHHVGDHDDDVLVLHRRLCVPVDGPRQPEQRRRHRRRQRQPDGALDGAQLAAIVEPGQRLEHLGRRPEPLLRLRLDAPRDEAVQRLGHLGYHRLHRSRGVLEPLLQIGDGAAGAVVDAAPPEQQVVEDEPERVDVHALVHLFAARLLRRHVGNGADDGAGHRRRLHGGRDPRQLALDQCREWSATPRRRRRGGHRLLLVRRRAGDAEVHDDGFGILLDHHVGRFEVAMHDAGVVSGLEAGRHLTRDGHHRRHRQAAGLPQHRGEVVAFDERHRDVLDAVDLTHVVNAHDVAMRHLAGEQQLLLEPAFDLLRGRRVPGHLGADDLHRHHHRELGVPRLIDGAHAADAQQAYDDVADAELLADGQRPFSRPQRRRRPHTARGRGGSRIDEDGGFLPFRTHPHRLVVGQGKARTVGGVSRMTGPRERLVRARASASPPLAGWGGDEIRLIGIECLGRWRRQVHRLAVVARNWRQRAGKRRNGPRELAGGALTCRLAHASPTVRACNQTALGRSGRNGFRCESIISPDP